MHAEILENEQSFEALLDGTFIHNKRLVVKVNNREAAQYFRSFYVFYDPQTEITELSGTLQSPSDKKAIKAKKKNISDRSYYDGFSIAVDDRYKILELDFPDQYPTIYTFWSSVKYLETVGLPTVSYRYPGGVVLKSAKLTLQDPENLIQYKLIDPKDLFTVNNSAGSKAFTLQNLRSKSKTNQSDLFVTGPAILLAPKVIQMDGTVGTFTTWSDMAAWNSSLIAAAGELPPSAIEEVESLVQNAKTDEEKIALIYDFVQKRSHYVSIQLGIGGWQPVSPAEVHETGYGDCKALTNYTRLLLDAVGVNASYCVIGVQDREIRFPDFVSASQMNHAMLAVPIEQDTVWLECTSQRTSPGYISSAASGRYALWIDKDGGSLVRTSGLLPSENLLVRNSTLTLAKDGSVQLSQKQWRRGNRLDLPIMLQSETANEQRRTVRKLYSHTLNDLRINYDIPFGVLNPEATVVIEASIPTYAKQLGTRLLLPAFDFQTPSRTLTDLLAAKEFFELDEASVRRDTVRFIAPSGMRITQLPERKVFATSYLTYSLSAKPTSSGVELIRQLTLRKTQLEGEELEEAKEFVRAISRTDRFALGVVKAQCLRYADKV